MGVLEIPARDGNITSGDIAAQCKRAKAMVDAGVDVIDVRIAVGESLTAGTERESLVAVVEAFDSLDATISIETHQPSGAKAGFEAGATVVNDPSGLVDARMRRIVAESGAEAILQWRPAPWAEPGSVVEAGLRTLTERMLSAERAGIDRSNLIVAPGFTGNITDPVYSALFDRIAEYGALQTRVMADLTPTTNTPISNGTVPTAAAAAMAAERGADLVRVHHVLAATTASHSVRRVTSVGGPSVSKQNSSGK